MGGSIPIIQGQDHLEAVWQQVLERLRGALNGATYSLTFERARALAFEGDRFRIGVETEFARGWIVQRYDSLVRDALFEVLGQDVVVVVEVIMPAPADPALPQASAPAVPPPPDPPAASPTNGLSARLQGQIGRAHV